MILNGCPDLPLEPPEMTYTQEQANDAFYDLEAKQKELDAITDEFDDVQYEMSRYKYLKGSGLYEKVLDYYSDLVAQKKDKIEEVKRFLKELGYEP